MLYLCLFQGQYPGQYQGSAQQGGPPTGYGAPLVPQQQQQQQPYQQQQQPQYGAPPQAQGPYAPPQQHAYAPQGQLPQPQAGGGGSGNRHPPQAQGPMPGVPRQPAYGQAPPTYGAPQGGPPPSRQAPQGAPPANYSGNYAPQPIAGGGYSQQGLPPVQQPQYGGAPPQQQQQSYGAPTGYVTAPQPSQGPPAAYGQQQQQQAPGGGYGVLSSQAPLPQQQQHQLYGGPQSLQTQAASMPYGGQQGPPPQHAQQQQYYQQQAVPPPQGSGYGVSAPGPVAVPSDAQHGYASAMPLTQQQHYAPPHDAAHIPQQAYQQQHRPSGDDHRYGAAHARGGAPGPSVDRGGGRAQGDGKGDRGGGASYGTGKTTTAGGGGGRDHRTIGGGGIAASRRPAHDDRGGASTQQQAKSKKKERGGRAVRERQEKYAAQKAAAAVAAVSHRRSHSPITLAEPSSPPSYAVHLPSYQLCATPSMDYLEVSRRYDRLVMPGDFVTAFRHLATSRQVPSWAATTAAVTPATGMQLLISSSGGTAAVQIVPKQEERSLDDNAISIMNTDEGSKHLSSVAVKEEESGSIQKGATTATPASVVDGSVSVSTINQGLGLSRTFNLLGSLPISHEIGSVKLEYGPLAQYDPAKPAVHSSSTTAGGSTKVGTTKNSSTNDNSATTTQPVAGSTVYNAKVVLLSGLSDAERAAALEGPGKEGGDHVSRLIKFIVARAGKNN